MDEKELELNDISSQLLIINQTTIDKLFSLENGAECVALYVFYYKTAKWQKTSVVKANDEYCMKCLKWGKERLNKAKKMLKENGLISVVQRRKDNKIIGWYIKVNYCIQPSGTNSYKYQNLLVGNRTQMLINNNINAYNNNINALKGETPTKKPKKTFVKPTLEEVRKYCEERNNNVDYEKFYDYYESNDWKDKNGNQVINWKMKLIANWENKSNCNNNNDKYYPKTIHHGNTFQLV